MFGDFCEKIHYSVLAKEYGTPLYVYSYEIIESKINELKSELGDHALICYAVKANSNGAILRIFANHKLGGDVVSVGELYRAIKAGIASKNIVFSGVGKTIDEMDYAIRQEIRMLTVESSEEYEQLKSLCHQIKKEARFSLRLNPDVDPKTHEYISTGLKKNKFGMEQEDVVKIYLDAKDDPYLKPVGLSIHIGSQITTLKPFEDALNIAVKLYVQMKQEGVGLLYLDCGGGLGIRYTNETVPSLQNYANVLLQAQKQTDCFLLVEPGRALVGEAGVLLTKVILNKKTKAKNFVVVDGAMNDLIRPSLYKAKHSIWAIEKEKKDECVVDVVGPICETGDFLGQDVLLPKVKSNDLIAIGQAGAYGASMSSQYNSRPRCAEVLVKHDKSHLIRERETLEDLINKERIPEGL